MANGRDSGGMMIRVPEAPRPQYVTPTPARTPAAPPNPQVGPTPTGFLRVEG